MLQKFRWFTNRVPESSCVSQEPRAAAAVAARAAVDPAAAAKVAEAVEAAARAEAAAPTRVKPRKNRPGHAFTGRRLGRFRCFC